MSDWLNQEVRTRIEAASQEMGGFRSFAPFAVGRPLGYGTDAPTLLVRGAHRAGADVAVSSADCFPLPSGMDPNVAILVPVLASALALWERAGLELGDAAATTAGHPLSPLVADLARRRGAVPSLVLGPAGDAPEPADGIQLIDWTDPDDATRRLTQIVNKTPGFAAVDLSGRPEIIDVFLEVMPRFGRLVLAGPPGGPTTVDFYKNVHRKGVVIASTPLEPAAVVSATEGQDIRAQIPRAAAILSNRRLAERCATLMGQARTRTAVPA